MHIKWFRQILTENVDGRAKLSLANSLKAKVEHFLV